MNAPLPAQVPGRVRLGDGWRLARIGGVLVRHGVAAVIREAPRMTRSKRGGSRALAVTLRRSFTELGPSFIKFGQLIASSPGLFPEELTIELRHLLDSLPPEPPDHAPRVIEAELGAPVEELFAWFDPEPIAAASIAQVHRARLHDGTEVAVKVARPGLRGRIDRDLRLMRFGAGAIERGTSIGRLARPVAVIDDFSITLHSEIDFRNEAALMVEFAENLARSEANAGVLVPTPIEGMIAEHVLVMTYIEGAPVDVVATSDNMPEDMLEVGLEAVRVWIEGSLLHGLFHGDVHAGNLFITPDGKVAILDFGIMGRLDPKMRDVIQRILSDDLPAILLQDDYDRVADIIDDLGVRAREGEMDYEVLANEVRELVRVELNRPLVEVSYGSILTSIVRIAVRYRLQLPNELILFVKQAIYFERYAKLIAPDINVLGEPELLRGILHGVLDRKALDRLQLMLVLVTTDPVEEPEQTPAVS